MGIHVPSCLPGYMAASALLPCLTSVLSCKTRQVTESTLEVPYYDYGYYCHYYPVFVCGGGGGGATAAARAVLPTPARCMYCVLVFTWAQLQ